MEVPNWPTNLGNLEAFLFHMKRLLWAASGIVVDYCVPRRLKEYIYVSYSVYTVYKTENVFFLLLLLLYAVLCVSHLS